MDKEEEEEEAVFIRGVNTNEEEEEAVFISVVNTNEDPPNEHQAQHRPNPRFGNCTPNLLEEEEVKVVFTRENRGGSAQHATRATPTRSSHGPMRA